MSIFDNLIYAKDKSLIDVSWIKWFHLGVPDEESESRQEVRRLLANIEHCLKCTALSGCYFYRNNKPKNHINCDCLQMLISKPVNEVVAICSIKKFTDYIFSDKYINLGKNKLFSILGFSKDDSKYLKDTYERQAKEKYLKGEYVLGKLDNFGQRISITIDLNSGSRSNLKFISGWLIHPLGKIVCTTPLGG